MLEHPFVEGVDDRVGEDHVVGRALLDQARQGRVHHALVDAQFVHQLHSGCGRLVGGNDIHCLTDEFTKVEAFGIVAQEIVFGAARSGDPCKRRVGNHMADVVLDDELGPAIDLDVADLSAVLFRQVLRERVLGLVHVVVDVENRVRQRTGRH